MIEIGGMWIKPEVVIAITKDFDVHSGASNCQIFFGPREDDYFTVPIDKDEAAKIINAALPSSPITHIKPLALRDGPMSINGVTGAKGILEELKKELRDKSL